jgi:hypothetical protein
MSLMYVESRQGHNRPYRDRKNTEGSKNELIKLMSAAIFPGSNPALSVRTVDYRN